MIADDNFASLIDLRTNKHRYHLIGELSLECIERAAVFLRRRVRASGRFEKRRGGEKAEERRKERRGRNERGDR